MTLLKPFAIQSINDAFTVNHHAFGVDVHDFCNQDDNITVFPGHGFMDGGCFAFAIAMQDYIGISAETQLYSVGRAGLRDHIVLQVINNEGMALYIDGDGLATEQDLLEKMRWCEHIEQPELVIFHPENEDTDALELFSYHEISVPHELTKRLRSTLGYFSPDALSLGSINAAAVAAENVDIEPQLRAQWKQ